MRATCLRVIDAASALFVANGYPSTTIETVASAAGVAEPTIYHLFGSKVDLLKAVVDTSLIGDDEPEPFGERSDLRAALAERDLVALIHAFASTGRVVMDRSAPIHWDLYTAAVVDPDAAVLLAEVQSQATIGRSRVVQALRRMSAIDPSVTIREAEDIVYTCLSFEVAHLIVESGLTASQYEAWLARSLPTVLQSYEAAPAPITTAHKGRPRKET